MASYASKKYVGSNFQDFDNGDSDTIDSFFISPVLNSKFVIIPNRLIFNFLFWFQQDVSESENVFYVNIYLCGAKSNDTFLTYGLSYKFE